MRWALTLIGEHLEGLEAKEVFQGIVGDAKDRLRTRGFHTVFEDFSLDVEHDLPILPETVPEPPPEVVERWEAEDGEAPELTGASLRAAIRRLKKEIGGNRILSQAEMAEKLGVSRYAIRKALGK